MLPTEVHGPTSCGVPRDYWVEFTPPFFDLLLRKSVRAEAMPSISSEKPGDTSAQQKAERRWKTTVG